MSQKQMPKKKQSTQTELFAYVKTAKHRFQKVPIQHGEQQKKKWQKNLKLVFHLSVSPTTIHVVKLIPLSSKQWWINTNEKWRLSCHLTSDNSNLAKHPLQYSGYDETYVISFVLTRQNQKFLNDTRETSLLTALLISQFVLSSCLRTAHSERLCC